MTLPNIIGLAIIALIAFGTFAVIIWRALTDPRHVPDDVPGEGADGGGSSPFHAGGSTSE